MRNHNASATKSFVDGAVHCPFVSVVMSVFNGELFLDAAVESILNQSYRAFEFVIVNDGSTDRSGLILSKYERSDPRVKVYHRQNRGLVDSLNFGCGEARGKYIARMDADDIATDDRLARQIEFMESHPEVGVVGGAVQFINASGTASKECFLPTTDREIRAGLLHDSVLVHPTVLIRMDAFERASGYRKVVIDAEDYDLWLRIADHHQLANLNSVVLKYRHHPYQVSVRRRRQQALSCLAAQVAASARRNGQSDPLNDIGQITPSALANLGVDESAQSAMLCRMYLGRVKSMHNAGEYATALELSREILSSGDLSYAEKWVVADLQLYAAKILWKENKLWDGFCNAISAITTRPLTLVRPFKPVLRWLGVASPQAQA